MSHAPRLPGRVLGRITLILITAAALLAPSGLATADGDQVTYSGRSVVVQVTALGSNVAVSDTGDLPPSGGAVGASLLEVDVAGVSAEVAHAAVVGQDQRTHAEASVASLEVDAGGIPVTAEFLASHAEASCDGGQAQVSGGSEIAALTIDGRAVSVSSEPNQAIAIPGGTIVVNEQSSSTDGRHGNMTVNALRITVVGVADVTISSSTAGISCAAEPEPADDFITGGGWITGTPSGRRANFGVAGGLKNGELWGHLTYVDHGERLTVKVKADQITAYEVTGERARRIEGTATVNGVDGSTFELELTDEGEPGRSDTFTLRLSDGYEASGTLTGGNIKLHER